MSCLQSLYNEKELNLSQSFREKLIWAAKGLDSGDRLSYLAYQLYPYLMEEMKREEANHNPQFLKAKSTSRRSDGDIMWALYGLAFL